MGTNEDGQDDEESGGAPTACLLLAGHDDIILRCSLLLPSCGPRCSHHPSLPSLAVAIHITTGALAITLATWTRGRKFQLSVLFIPPSSPFPSTDSCSEHLLSLAFSAFCLLLLSFRLFLCSLCWIFISTTRFFHPPSATKLPLSAVSILAVSITRVGRGFMGSSEVSSLCLAPAARQDQHFWQCYNIDSCQHSSCVDQK